MASVVLLVALGACASERKGRADRAPPATPIAPVVGAPPGVLSPSTGAPDAYLYEIELDDALATLGVRLCVDGALPPTLVPGDARAARYLTAAALETAEGTRALDIDDGRVLVGDARETCVRLRIDVARAAWHEASPTCADRVGDDLVVAPDLFLWRGATPPDGPVRARFFVPSGVKVSTAWPRDGDGFVVPASTYRLYGRVVIGRAFVPLEVEVPGGVLDVAILDGAFAPAPDVVRDFLALAGRAVSTAWGRFPRTRAQVTLTPVPADGVPFGMVVRGGGPGVHLLLGMSTDAHALAADWVTVHELSHLLTPAIAPRDAWFGEGIATWYQGVLRARAGLIDEREAWAALLDGLARGSRANDGMTLAESSAAMRRAHNYTRVYWGGTAFALRADVLLRERGKGSLDDALRALEACCAESSTPHRARALVEEMARAMDAPELMALHDEITGTRAFPDVAPALSALGVSLVDGEVRLDPAPEKVALRAGIVGARLATTDRSRAAPAPR